ncbi:hypothetical protein L3X38_037263 [Prunus dulcis]|uniref:NADH:ubiquinone oxidoreductase-like 20kDa subunit domain-containing protein n=1 Tax=Prunus dulcis TaxID=3755 RepID=A0AAD4YQ83_PRUDU|nr:hypothetical protein L3X38_037263 [Prunus dulcis]
MCLGSRNGLEFWCSQAAQNFLNGPCECLYPSIPQPSQQALGGMFSNNSYSAVWGFDKLIPVDIYLPGCPPKPEGLSEIDMSVKTWTTSTWTERPHDSSLFPGIGLAI